MTAKHPLDDLTLTEGQLFRRLTGWATKNVHEMLDWGQKEMILQSIKSWGAGILIQLVDEGVAPPVDDDGNEKPIEEWTVAESNAIWIGNRAVGFLRGALASIERENPDRWVAAASEDGEVEEEPTELEGSAVPGYDIEEVRWKAIETIQRHFMLCDWETYIKCMAGLRFIGEGGKDEAEFEAKQDEWTEADVVGWVSDRIGDYRESLQQNRTPEEPGTPTPDNFLEPATTDGE